MRATAADALDSLAYGKAGCQHANTRPLIRVEPGKAHALATMAENALIAAKAPIYVRGGSLVRPVSEEVNGAHGTLTHVARLTEVGSGTLLDWLSRVARWERFDGRSNDWRPVDPAPAAIAVLLARDGEWGFPILTGMLTCPTLRPDGTVLAEAGYDPVTRLLLIEPPTMPRIPDRPTKQDAAAALGLLDGLLKDFPFVNGSSRSVGLSALITPVARGAMAVVPAHIARATTPGTGKSYLNDLVAAIAIGQRCPVIAAGRNEEETEKRLVAALLAGAPLISVDNLNGEFSGDFLCQLIERPTVEVRRLGRSELVRLESRCTILATGNNLIPAGDVVRRVLIADLDANSERPELRAFTGNPFASILAERGRYIAAALTVCRGYLVAGRPNRLAPLASFEEWSGLVRSALVWLGRDDPCETMEAARADDPETGALRALVSAWREAVPSRALTAGELIACAAEAEWTGDGDAHDRATSRLRFPDLQEALSTIAGDGRGINPMRLAKRLGRWRGRIVDGMRIEIDSRGKSPRWRLIDATSRGAMYVAS